MKIKTLVGGRLAVKTLDNKIRGRAKDEKRSRRVGSLLGKRGRKGDI
jgi:hypothetical protein